MGIDRRPPGTHPDDPKDLRPVVKKTKYKNFEISTVPERIETCSKCKHLLTKKPRYINSPCFDDKIFCMDCGRSRDIVTGDTIPCYEARPKCNGLYFEKKEGK